MRRYFLIVLILFAVGSLYAQPSLETDYPRGYFRNPLDIPISLSANFGEVRTNHWHMGLDFRTNQRVNLPVFAAAGGYVSRIGIRPLSFGRFMVIDHPNGLSTLYAHLNSFYPELEKYVSQKQNELESWAVELTFTRDQFPLKKGDFIARSGTTGGSGGPHLHFEIRETETGKCLNPLLFGFNVKDEVPPVISRLALYNRNISVYRQSPLIVPIRKSGSSYRTSSSKIITGTNKISFAIAAYDKLNNSYSPEGIYSANVFLDDKKIGSFVIDNFDYDESDYINAHIDYSYKAKTNVELQHLSRMVGDQSSIYKMGEGDGIVVLNDNEEHIVKVEVFDANENKTTLIIPVQYVQGHELKLPEENGLKLSPLSDNVFERNGFKAYLPAGSLYDTVHVNFRQSGSNEDAISPTYHFNDGTIPIHGMMKVKIRADRNVGEKSKVLIVREWKGKKSARPATWEDGWVTAEFGEFGNFTAVYDNEKPRVNAPARGDDTLIISSLRRFTFTPVDNYGLKSFRAELNDKWLKFTNDKGRTHIYNFGPELTYGTHKLYVRVEDLAGNVLEKTWWVKRGKYVKPARKRRR